MEKNDAYQGRLYRKGLHIPAVIAALIVVIILILVGARASSKRDEDLPGNTGSAAPLNAVVLMTEVQETEFSS